MGLRGGGAASVGRADKGTTSRLQRDGEYFDNSDVYVLDMRLELAGGVFEAMKSGLHIGWLLLAISIYSKSVSGTTVTLYGGYDFDKPIHRLAHQRNYPSD